MNANTIVWKYDLPIGSFVILKNKPEHAVSVKQIHTGNVVSVQDAKMQLIEADGIYWTWKDLETASVAKPIPLILTADCLPIILLGKSGGCLLHAGWRGVKAQIHLTSAVRNLDPYYYFIGPSIQHFSFEVTSEFLDNFSNKNFFTLENNRYTFNLQAQVKHDLESAFPSIKGTDCGIDTFTDLRFQSYRRSKGNRTNNYNVFLMG